MPTKQTPSAVTCHADGSVTYWSVTYHGYLRNDFINDRDWKSLSASYKKRIERHWERYDRYPEE
jgi:hypothetical protein